MIRKGKQRIKIFVEGHTEQNYISELNKAPNIEISIKPVNMKGGGYSEFLKQIRKESSDGFLASFILIDLDKAMPEKKELNQLIEFCNKNNEHSDIPYILIGNNPDFEFFACSHCPDYKKRSTDQYIIKDFGYKDLATFKSDKKIYGFLNSNKCSYKIALEALSKGKTYFTHSCKKEKDGLDVSIVLSGNVKINTDSLSSKHSNMKELFDMILE